MMKNEKGDGTGRNRKIDDVAIYRRFAMGIQEGLSIEAVSENPLTFWEFRRDIISRRWEPRVRTMTPANLERHWRRIKPSLHKDARGLARHIPPEEAERISRQALANARFNGRPVPISPEFYIEEMPQPGRPKK